MDQTQWRKLRIRGGETVWQLYHENSKFNRFGRPLLGQALIDWQLSLQPSLCYAHHPAIQLPGAQHAFKKPFEQLLFERRTAQDLVKAPVPLSDLATLLYYAYGITEASEEGVFPHGRRAVPSAGALYPLELYVHASAVEGIPAGIYHYEPAAHVMRRFADGDRSEKLATCLVQPEFALHASFTIFITALFARTTTKYGERGYRFALLEAGHVGQNLTLVASALGLGITSIGGFIDFRVDELLDIDGVNQSALYLFAIGGSQV